jgi:peptidoglycan/xylan/chitin deacetylase (PgdA/CDA1 family)
MYHQIATPPCDPWQLSVSPENFEAHLSILKRDFTVLSLDEMIQNIKGYPYGKRMIAITFDDGFRDNCDTAAPLLEKYRLPASFYIATKLINSEGMFWWDMIQHLILYTEKLPTSIDINISDRTFHYELGTDSVLTVSLRKEIGNWNYELPIPNRRVQLYYKIWEQLKLLSIEEREDVILKLKSWAGESYTSPGLAGVMNVTQLQALCKNALFKIGAHTVNHPALAMQGIEEQIFEIQQSKKMLEGWLNMKIKSFAYPYGNYDLITLRLIKEAGFQNAVTTEEKSTSGSSGIFELPRYQVKNWSGDEFYKRLSNWLKN